LIDNNNFDKVKDDFINYLSAQRGCSEHTLRAYSNDLLQFFEYYSQKKGIRIDKIDNLQIEYVFFRGYLAYLQQQGMAKSTINRKVIALRSFYKYLKNNNLVEKNPLEMIKTLKIPKKIPEILHEKDIISILEESFYDPNPLTIRDKAIFETLYSTGLRVSELTSLRMDSINFSNKYIRVIGKGDIQTQTDQALYNIDTALKASGATFDHIVKLTFYIVEGQDVSKVFQTFQQVFKFSTPPSITSLIVSGLANPDYLIEMDAVAFLPN